MNKTFKIQNTSVAGVVVSLCSLKVFPISGSL